MSPRPPTNGERGSKPPSPFVHRQITVRVRRITHLDVIEVLEHELDDLAAAYSQTHQDLTVAIGLFGIALACGLSLLTSWTVLPPPWIAVLTALLFTSSLWGLWFLGRWARARKRGPELLARIKARRPEILLTEESEASEP